MPVTYYLLPINHQYALISTDILKCLPKLCTVSTATDSNPHMHAYMYAQVLVQTIILAPGSTHHYRTM